MKNLPSILNILDINKYVIIILNSCHFTVITKIFPSSNLLYPACSGRRFGTPGIWGHIGKNGKGSRVLTDKQLK